MLVGDQRSGYVFVMDAGVLPVKALARAKQRLDPHFGSDERVAIACALLEDALALCTACDFLTWWVVSDDPAILEEARLHGFAVVADAGAGLNEALITAVTELDRAGAESMTVIPADVPLAYRGDIVDLLDTGATSEIVVVPSARGGGTNGLYLSPPALIEPRFGEASFQAHIRLAERRGMRCSMLNLPRLALDIDTIEDVDAFLQQPERGPSKTRDVLRALRGEPEPR